MARPNHVRHGSLRPLLCHRALHVLHNFFKTRGVQRGSGSIDQHPQPHHMVGVVGVQQRFKQSTQMIGAKTGKHNQCVQAVVDGAVPSRWHWHDGRPFLLLLPAAMVKGRHHERTTLLLLCVVAIGQPDTDVVRPWDHVEQLMGLVHVQFTQFSLVINANATLLVAAGRCDLKFQPNTFWVHGLIELRCDQINPRRRP